MIKKLLDMFFRKETAEEIRIRVRNEIKESTERAIKTNWYHQAGSRHESY